MTLHVRALVVAQQLLFVRLVLGDEILRTDALAFGHRESGELIVVVRFAVCLIAKKGWRGQILRIVMIGVRLRCEAGRQTGAQQLIALKRTIGLDAGTELNGGRMTEQTFGSNQIRAELDSKQTLRSAAVKGDLWVAGDALCSRNEQESGMREGGHNEEGDQQWLKVKQQLGVQIAMDGNRADQRQNE